MTRVLVIDDQPDVRAMICILLRVNHCEVTEAATAVAGLKLFEQSAFDVAIVDVFLGDANGFDVIAMLRKTNPGFPVVAISGMPSFDEAAPSAERDGVVCLRKPFRPNDLFSAIEAARRLQGQDDGVNLTARTG